MTVYVQPMPSNGSEQISVSQPSLSANSTYLKSCIEEDHNFTSNDANADDGYHKVIHQVKQLVDPGAIAGVNQVYAKDYTPAYAGAPTDTQLFNISGLGGISQLTGTDSESDGWQWIGGVLLQWGRVIQNFSSGSTTGTVVFQNRGPTNRGIPFPNNCFVVMGTPFVTFGGLPGSSASVNIRTTSLSPNVNSKLQFQYQFFANSSSYTGFNWIAIGN